MFKSQLGSVVHTIPPIVNNGNYEGKMANVGNECTNALGLINIYIDPYQGICLWLLAGLVANVV